MLYVLTGDKTKYGWGAPIAVFEDKENIKKFITKDLERCWGDITDISIKMDELFDYVDDYRTISASCYKKEKKYNAEYCLFSFQDFNGLYLF